MCKWNQQDLPDITEIERSHAIANFQGNQNPLVLDVTLAERAYCNSSRLFEFQQTLSSVYILSNIEWQIIHAGSTIVLNVQCCTNAVIPQLDVGSTRFCINPVVVQVLSVCLSAQFFPFRSQKFGQPPPPPIIGA